MYIVEVYSFDRVEVIYSKAIEISIGLGIYSFNTMDLLIH